MSNTQAARNKRHKELNEKRGLCTVSVVVPVARSEELKDLCNKWRTKHIEGLEAQV